MPDHIHNKKSSNHNSEAVVNAGCPQASRIILICNTCKYEWESSIDNHINGSRSCPNCVGYAPWTYDRFINKSAKIHNDRFEYSRIAQSDISTGDSRIIIICNTCKHVWEIII